MNLFRYLPSVDALARACEKSADNTHNAPVPQAYLNDLASSFLDQQRTAIRNGEITDPNLLKLDALLPGFASYAAKAAATSLQRVLNATGVVLHTNMGRSALAPEALAAVVKTAVHYSNLELDLETGERGSRYSHVEDLLKHLTGAEAAIVVNNNAAAVLLVLDALCKGGEVPVSRGQMVEIGGSFRIPDIMERSGCTLVEVGTTNRTHLEDYEAALNENTTALLRVHTSNYRVIGFTAAVGLAELADLAHSRGLPLIEDLGSGSLIDFSPYGLPDEPTVPQAIAQGADVVTFSGDKLLGGPQAGIICGKEEYIARIRKNPLNRALRVDKMTLAALEGTLRLYLDPKEAAARIPTVRRLIAPPEELAERAATLLRLLRRHLPKNTDLSLTPGISAVGGGSFPMHGLPTTLVRVASPSHSAESLRRRLLATNPPMLVRVEHDALHLDVRTLIDEEFVLVKDALVQALNGK